MVLYGTGPTAMLLVQCNASLACLSVGAVGDTCCTVWIERWKVVRVGGGAVEAVRLGWRFGWDNSCISCIIWV